MAVQAKVGTFGSKTSTGSQAYTGVGFQPEALIFLMSGSAHTSINSFTTNGTIGFGFASSSSARCAFCAGSSDNVGTMNNVRRAINDGCLLWEFPGASGAINADLTSFDADGFTLNYAGANGTARSFSYLALAGDPTVKAGVFQVGTSGSSVAVTGVGFQPSLLLLIHGGANTVGSVAGNWYSGIGAASSTSDRAAMVGVERSGTTDSNTVRTLLSDCVILSTDSDGVVDMKCDLASFDSDGFTISVGTNPAAAADIGYLAIGGVSAKVGVETQKTSSGTKATSGLGFTPSALLLGSGVAAHSTSGVAGMSQSVGFADGTTNACQYTGGGDNLGTSDENKIHSNTKVIKHHNTTGGAALAEASVSSFASDTFTLNWSTADATAREFFYVALGEAVAPPASFVPRVMVF